MKKPRILLVEHDADMALDIRVQLAGLGYETVGTATPGEDAIRLAAQLQPDLVLMDVHLAGPMDGIAAAQAIRRQLAIPVVFLTTSAQDEALLRAKFTEPLGCILKPFSERELRPVLELARYKSAMENKMRQSEERFRTIFEAEPECVKLMGADGSLLEMNAAGLAILEAGSVAQANTHGLINFVSPAYRGAFAALHRRALDGQAGVLEFEGTGLHGTRRWLQAHVTPLRDAQGQITMTLDVTRDITQYKHAQDALRESEERYRQLVDRSPYAIGVHQHGKLVFANRAAHVLFGATTDGDLLGRPILDLIHPQHRQAAQARIGRMLRGETGLYPADDRYIKLDGTPFDVEVSAAALSFGGEPAVQVIALDISVRKQAEAALHETTRQLRVLSRRVLEAQETERRRVAVELHDELGQSLTAIKINLQSAQRFGGRPRDKLTTENVRIVEDALVQVRRLALALRPSILDDLGLAPALRWIAEQTAARGGFAVDFYSSVEDARLAPEIEVAGFRIVQEALTNTMRHAGAQHVWIDLRQDGHELVLCVRDDGCGFDVGAMRERAALGGSIGVLGMQERAGLIGGSLAIESSPGQGSSLCLRCRWRGAGEPQ